MTDVTQIGPKQKQVWFQSKRERNLFGLALCAVLIACAALAFSLTQPKPPVFISVSVKSLIEGQMRSSIDPTLTPTEIETRASEYIVALQTVLNGYQSDGDVVIITSEAILGDTLPDFTDQVGQEAFELAAAMASERGVTVSRVSDEQMMIHQLESLAQRTQQMTAQLKPGPTAALSDQPPALSTSGRQE